jgi:hypothetical protein
MLHVGPDGEPKPARPRKAHAPGAGHGHRRRGPPDIRSSPPSLAPSIPFPFLPSLTLSRWRGLPVTLRSYHHHLYIIPDRLAHTHRPAGRRGATAQRNANAHQPRRRLSRRAVPARSFLHSGAIRLRPPWAPAVCAPGPCLLRPRGRRGARDRG